MVAATISPARAGTRFFYVWMAGLCALVAIGGFAPTFWLQLPASTFVGSPLLYLHALIFTAWPLLFLSQTWLEASDRLEHHRAWGLVGIALATAMLLVGAAAAIQGAANRVGEHGDRALGFLIVPLSAVTLFAALFAAAIVYRRRTEVHRRLMLLATIALLQPAIVRVFFTISTGGGPGLRPGIGGPPPLQMTILPGLIADLLVVAAMLYDWRTRGRVHPVYLIGLPVLLAVQFLRIPLSTTPQWLATAKALVAFAG